ncbi:ATP-grasp domain-containing protein [Paenibacillus sp. 22594]|uniref:ATP-grasp domain-containing protein n=1 Tax=Paenibacillus sp. 22594 TaxID=3453947 RepID=UPI003F8333CC
MTTDPTGNPAVMNVLITGGRAPVALELSRLLRDAGHRVYVAESARHHLCRVSSAVERSFRVPPPRHSPAAYIDELARLVEELDIDVLMPLCEEIFYISASLDRITGCRVLSAGREMLARLHHKANFIIWARELGFTVPATRLLSSLEEWNNQTDEAARMGEAWVYKPAYSRFASKVILPGKFTGGQESLAGPRSLAAPPGLCPAAPWVAQQFIKGAAICTYSVVHQGELAAHAAYGSGYRTGKAGASVYFEPLEHPGALEWIQRFVHATGFSGQIGFDFIQAEDDVLYPIECNPRATSGIHLFAPEDGLVQALLSPELLAQHGSVSIPRSGKKAMLALPMLACGLRPGPGGLNRWNRAYRAAEDVIFRKEDMRPFLEQFRVVYQAYRLARRNKISVTEALTEDIEWNGE